jgi:hypothetical protein
MRVRRIFGGFLNRGDGGRGFYCNCPMLDLFCARPPLTLSTPSSSHGPKLGRELR